MMTAAPVTVNISIAKAVFNASKERPMTTITTTDKTELFATARARLASELLDFLRL